MAATLPTSHRGQMLVLEVRGIYLKKRISDNLQLVGTTGHSLVVETPCAQIHNTVQRINTHIRKILAPPFC